MYTKICKATKETVCVEFKFSTGIIEVVEGRNYGECLAWITKTFPEQEFEVSYVDV